MTFVYRFNAKNLSLPPSLALPAMAQVKQTVQNCTHKHHTLKWLDDFFFMRWTKAKLVWNVFALPELRDFKSKHEIHFLKKWVSNAIFPPFFLLFFTVWMLANNIKHISYTSFEHTLNNIPFSRDECQICNQQRARNVFFFTLCLFWLVAIENRWNSTFRKMPFSEIRGLDVWSFATLLICSFLYFRWFWATQRIHMIYIFSSFVSSFFINCDFSSLAKGKLWVLVRERVFKPFKRISTFNKC